MPKKYDPEVKARAVRMEHPTAHRLDAARNAAAEFGRHGDLSPIRIDAPEVMMDEALICLRERSGGKLVRAFWKIAEQFAADR